ncbi:sodium/calcium exchanger family protein [Candidatus Endolissoclinum faulkneri L2]|uniref:Sodium/calcium exchanger family protein n=1 Tax=Candidatus Endolissoclinum faulkneri L2 TaxID=1193729 RepID=K7YH05_9PROT|nr:calcium/sodium antiporter [Candidatus Endolissoclinum faulkneri]AFX98840.1 sodium/calcium exchanger family protein [Candidatus Endolissoclinum faulkneri L2]
MISLGFIFVGLVLLLVGAEIMIKGAVAFAQRINISSHIVGLTVIGFGTSTPELFVSFKAAINCLPGIAIGNVIGSNIANILLLIGIVGMISPFLCNSVNIRRDGIILIIGTMIFVGISINNSIIERWHGAIMVTILLVYLFYCYREEQRQNNDLSTEKVEKSDFLITKGWCIFLYMSGGLIAVLAGARFLLDGAVSIANHIGISETVIGITIVAVGTSLPELATTIVAALHRHNNLALGNIIGSNIFNTMGIIGITALVNPLPVPQDVTILNLWFMLSVTILFIAMAIVLPKFNRTWAMVFLTTYVIFIIYQFFI